ncbi:SRPBCC family protein [Streptomyces rugosispiralis]|uniref:SRPBCC family protein n=1 Tax=Streptomyces rugosispiralis TaxID=2967341 RepID=A0ABT1V3K5_9ACTN|nr:SRPBCC family protein [Streptomyces rugosispiralis]MCQ8191959.1 SRPBCC family protein [Streptomyces rugosispiralis]
MSGNRPSPSRNHVRTTALTIALAAAGVLGTAAPQAQAAPARAKAAQAAHHNDPSTCRGEGVDPTARIRYRSDVVIKAPLSTVFALQTDVERWPGWQPSVRTMERLDPGPLRKGSRFRWTTPAPATPTTPATTLDITSTVHQLKRDSCIRWSGPAIGEGLRIDEGVHVWTFTKVGGGVRVHTEETWRGDQVEADVPTATEALGQGLEAWLSDLKTTAEAANRHDRRPL